LNARNRFLIILGIIVIAATVYYLVSTPRSSDLVLIGTVDSNQIIISPQIPGRIAKLLVDEGTQVKQGDLIAILDPSELEAEARAAAAMIDSLVSTVRPLAEKNGNTLAVECPAEIGTMDADLTRVRQVLLNVLGNAAKFTEHGSIMLRVSLADALDAQCLPVGLFGVTNIDASLTFRRIFHAHRIPLRNQYCTCWMPNDASSTRGRAADIRAYSGMGSRNERA